jgi:hypothetical protein
MCAAAHGWFYDWQTLIAGLLGLAGGVIAYVGALRAANRQVVAVQQQIADLRAARCQDDDRHRSVLQWAIRTEGRRLGAAVQALRGNALPSQPQPASRSREQLIIQSSPLLRGERAEMALLDDQMRSLLEEVAGIVDEYNARIETANASTITRGPQIDQQILTLIDRLAERTCALRALCL